MAKRREAWECNFCLKVFETESMAKTCEDSHLHINDINITNFEQMDNGVCYMEGHRLPTMIRVAGKKADAEAIYVLKGAVRKRKKVKDTPEDPE